MTRTEDRSLIT